MSDQERKTFEEEKKAESEETIRDLDVSEEDAKDVKGGTGRDPGWDLGTQKKV